MVLQHIAVQYLLVTWVVKYRFDLVVQLYYMVLPSQGGGESPGSPTRKWGRGGIDLVQNFLVLLNRINRINQK